MKKTNKIRALEARFGGRPANEIIAEAINRAGSMEAAAEQLGIATQTLYMWTVRLGIHIKKVAYISRPGHSTVTTPGFDPNSVAV